MHRNRPFSSLQRCALRHAATVSIARQHRLPMTAEVLRILPPEGVRGRAKTHHEHLSAPHGQCVMVCSEASLDLTSCPRRYATGAADLAT